MHCLAKRQPTCRSTRRPAAACSGHYHPKLYLHAIPIGDVRKESLSVADGGRQWPTPNML